MDVSCLLNEVWQLQKSDYGKTHLINQPFKRSYFISCLYGELLRVGYEKNGAILTFQQISHSAPPSQFFPEVTLMEQELHCSFT